LGRPLARRLGAKDAAPRLDLAVKDLKEAGRFGLNSYPAPEPFSKTWRSRARAAVGMLRGGVFGLKHPTGKPGRLLSGRRE
jgi:hypothetical protein